MRKALWAVAAVLLLAVGLWLGGTAAWRLHEAATEKGCVRIPADVAPAQLAPAVPGHVRFAVLGDTGTGNEGARQVAGVLRQVCAREGCDFVALLGDNFYPDGVRSADDPLFQTAFESVYAGLQAPVLAILGNHDVHSDPVFQVFYSQRSGLWRMPNYEYDYRVGPARFFAINTNCQPVTWWRLTPQVEAPWRGWTFVLGHHSLYSEGPHGDANATVRWYWGAAQPHVDFYLAGHNHILEHLQRAGEETDYVVSGSGGAQLNEGVGSKGPSGARSRFRSEAAGFAWFDVTATQATLRFYDGSGALLYEYRRTRPAR